MILTVLEARLPADCAQALSSAFHTATRQALPPGLMRTQLVRDARDPLRWRIQTWWASQGALEAMRGAGTPAGVLMFRAAGAEPELSIFEVGTEVLAP